VQCKDGAGNISALYPINFTVNYDNPPIISTVTGPRTVTVGQSNSWIINATDPENNSMQYVADSFGDGVPSGYQFQSSPVFSHTYTKTGTFTAYFGVRDIFGAQLPAT